MLDFPGKANLKAPLNYQKWNYSNNSKISQFNLYEFNGSAFVVERIHFMQNT